MIPRLPLLVPTPSPWDIAELALAVGALHLTRDLPNGKRRVLIRLGEPSIEVTLSKRGPDREPEPVVIDWLEDLGAIRMLSEEETTALGKALGGVS